MNSMDEGQIYCGNCAAGEFKLLYSRGTVHVLCAECLELILDIKSDNIQQSEETKHIEKIIN